MPFFHRYFGQTDFGLEHLVTVLNLRSHLERLPVRSSSCFELASIKGAVALNLKRLSNLGLALKLVRQAKRLIEGLLRFLSPSRLRQRCAIAGQDLGHHRAAVVQISTGLESPFS